MVKKGVRCGRAIRFAVTWRYEDGNTVYGMSVPGWMLLRNTNGNLVVRAPTKIGPEGRMVTVNNVTYDLRRDIEEVLRSSGHAKHVGNDIPGYLRNVLKTKKKTT